MATGRTVQNAVPMMTPQNINHPSHGGAPVPITPQMAVSPPSKPELASWWKKFRKNNDKNSEKVDLSPGIFGVELEKSIRYANVAISLTNEQGESFIYGYVPIVVAKCGVFLKEKATDVEGIFRLSGSAKRIKDLQTIFNSPDRYGKGLDWTGYTVHDAANILRRYLNQLPEPIVPLDFYDKFRDPIRSHQAQAVGDMDGQGNDIGNFDHNSAVTEYQKLITQLPPLNRQLLLYILDLLAVFSSKSDLNRMTSANLAAIFQPGIISHPSHDMSPLEYKLSQDVLIFLVENQDNFLIGMTGTAVDEKTLKDVESGPPTYTPKSTIGRSASNASAGADSLRKYGVRRNVSVSSKGSRERGSNGIPSPVPSGSNVPYASASSTGSLGRSNTVPSKKSPGLASARFQRPAEPSTHVAPVMDPASPLPASATAEQSFTEKHNSPKQNDPASAPKGVTEAAFESRPIPGDGAISDADRIGPVPAPRSLEPVQPPTRERKISSLFSRSPTVGPSDSVVKDQRQPNKLRKKPRIPGSANESAQSSQNSLHGDGPPAFHTPLMSPELSSSSRPDPLTTTNPIVSNTAPTPTGVVPPGNSLPGSLGAAETQPPGSALRPAPSPEPSIHSRSSMADASDFDTLDDPALRSEKPEKHRHRWRFSSSAKNSDSPLIPPPLIGQNAGARTSNSSIGSSSRPRKSFTGDSQLGQSLGTEMTGTGQPSGSAPQESSDAAKDSAAEPEKKGFLGKWKAKMSQTKEERNAEKERAKSPPRSDGEGGSRTSLSAFAHDLSHRGRSLDKSREELVPTVLAVPKEEANAQTLAQSQVQPQPADLAPFALDQSSGT